MASCRTFAYIHLEKCQRNGSNHNTMTGKVPNLSVKSFCWSRLTFCMYACIPSFDASDGGLFSQILPTLTYSTFVSNRSCRIDTKVAMAVFCDFSGDDKSSGTIILTDEASEAPAFAFAVKSRSPLRLRLKIRVLSNLGWSA